MPSYRTFESINNFVPSGSVLPWTWLNRDSCPVRSNILFGWKSLLGQRLPERKYTQFLAQHAAFFFASPMSTYFILTEIRLGGDMVIDFATPIDEASAGIHYRLTEIEPPYEAPFTKSGDKSRRLSHSLDQIEQWKTWLKRNRAMAKKIFPCAFVSADARFSFNIVIGTRQNTEPWFDRRNELSGQLGIEIRTHDSLTDWASKQPFLDTSGLCSSEETRLSKKIRNSLANPFYIAFGDAKWREMSKVLEPNVHFHAWNAAEIIAHREYNECLSVFEDFCLQADGELTSAQTEILESSGGD